MEKKIDPPVVEERLLPAGMKIEKTDTLVSPVSQKRYRIETVEDDNEAMVRSLPPGERDVQPSAAAPVSENYAGTARKAATLSIANAPTETFPDLKDLIATLPAHAVMVNPSPKILTAATSNRVAEENRNVKLKAFLYAASRENDNDYRLIIGRAKGSNPAVYFTIELSGLPPANSASFTKLKAARTDFSNYFGSKKPGGNYDFYTPPIPIEVEGSLFFDMSHAAGPRPGPSALRPKMPVVWEIHPISKLVFEP